MNLVCDVCKKTFGSENKKYEHFSSKSHIIAAKKAETNKSENSEVKERIEQKTTKDDNTICLFCNLKNETIGDNVAHMIKAHKFEVPFAEHVKNVNGMMKVIIKKIFEYLSCLSCDLQGFKNYKSLQNHMLDTQHTYINAEDLEEFLYKYYDKERLLAIDDKEKRKTKEFRVLKMRLRRANKKKADNNEDGWETISEGDEDDEERVRKDVPLVYDSEDEEIGNIVLPSGELLTEGGKM
jgi:hypothetical protein